jgi:hypothetical protein
MHEGRGRNHQAYLWQYGIPGGAVVFDFRLGRGREGSKQFLKQFKGILQTDGYAAYDHGDSGVVHAACWAHSRRKFVEAVRLNPSDAMAARTVAMIDELFAIDAEARLQKMDHATRHALRLQKAPAVLDRIRRQIASCEREALPASALRKACRYTLALWPKLTRLLERPGFGAVQQSGGARCDRAGPKVTAALSIVEADTEPVMLKTLCCLLMSTNSIIQRASNGAVELVMQWASSRLGISAAVQNNRVKSLCKTNPPFRTGIHRQ